MSGIARVGLAALALALVGGCAPVAVAPGSFSVGVAPGIGLTASQCSLLVGSSEAARMGVRSASVQAFGMRHRMQQLQARFSLASDARGIESWRRIASGEC
jgi:hypothetical protein